MHRGRAQVQRIIKEFEGAPAVGSPFGGVGHACLGAVAASHQPEAKLRGVADPEVGFTEQFLHEHLDVFLRNPRAAQARINLRCGEIRGLHSLQRVHVAQIFFIDQRRRFGGHELRSHVSGQIFVFSLPAVGLWIEKNDALEFRQKRFRLLMEQRCEILDIDTAALSQRHEQRILRCLDFSDLPFALDGALAKDRGFRGSSGFFIVKLQRKQEGQIRINAECNGVGAF